MGMGTSRFARRRGFRAIIRKYNMFCETQLSEPIRPEFQTAVRRQRINPITDQMEPYLQSYERIMRLIGSGVAVLFSVIAWSICLHIHFLVVDCAHIRDRCYHVRNNCRTYIQSN